MRNVSEASAWIGISYYDDEGDRGAVECKWDIWCDFWCETDGEDHDDDDDADDDDDHVVDDDDDYDDDDDGGGDNDDDGDDRFIYDIL